MKLALLIIAMMAAGATVSGEDSLAWFRNANTGINADRLAQHEKNRLAQVHQQLLQVQINCPGFLDAAVGFAKTQKPNRSGDFCSLLKYFEAVYFEERQRQLSNYQSAFANSNNKPNKI
jgi:hypothetical protein